MQDQLFVQWSKDTEYTGKAATLHALVIHAMIVLLTNGEPQGWPMSPFFFLSFLIFI